MTQTTMVRNEMDSADARTFRTVMSRFVTGVTVVTAAAPEQPVGMTANSFTSVSLDPPLVLICLGRASATGRAIRRAGAFAVNILSCEQEDVSRAFAGRIENRFSLVGTTEGVTGSPILRDALAYVECRIADEFRGGDHAIVLGHVVSAGLMRERDALTFFSGSYGKTSTAAAGNGRARGGAQQ